METREVDVAVKVIERTAADEPLGELVDDRDRFHGPDVVRRRQVAQRFHIATEAVGLAERELPPVVAVSFRAVKQRVVHVGDILCVDDLMPGVAPGTDQEVPGGEGRGVPHVRRVVGGDPAGIERRPVPAGRNGELPCRRVVQPYLCPAARQSRDLSATPCFHEARLQRGCPMTSYAPAYPYYFDRRYRICHNPWESARCAHPAGGPNLQGRQGQPRNWQPRTYHEISGNVVARQRPTFPDGQVTCT